MTQLWFSVDPVLKPVGCAAIQGTLIQKVSRPKELTQFDGAADRYCRLPGGYAILFWRENVTGKGEGMVSATIVTEGYLRESRATAENFRKWYNIVVERN